MDDHMSGLVDAGRETGAENKDVEPRFEFGKHHAAEGHPLMVLFRSFALL